MTGNNSRLREHNLQQREYFKLAEKRTMLPEETPYNERQANELVQFGNLAAGEKVLEVGCGMGRHAFYLARRDIKFEGLDLSPELIERFRLFDDGRYNPKLYVGDILDYSTEFKGRFDAVIGFFMLHHLFSNLPEYFSAMAGMLKPGGRLIFMEPNPYNPLYYLQIFFTPGMTWRAERGITQMRQKVIFGAMRQAGLNRLALKRFGFFPRFIVNQNWSRPTEAVLENVGLWRSLLPFQIFKGYRL